MVLELPVGSVSSSVDKRKRLPCQHNDDDDDDDDTQAAKIMGCSFPDLPEDVWFSIHSLMPMREAAQAACLSRTFLRSWRCRPILIFNKDTIGLDISMSGGKFSRKVDRVLSKHSGIGVKIFKLDYLFMDEFDARRYLKRWLPVVVKPGIEELTLILNSSKKKYTFPWSLLSGGIGSSIRHLNLRLCALRPTAELGPLRNLTSLHLSMVSITGDELEGLLYNCLALEQLEVFCCRKIIFLKIPCALQQLSSLSVLYCEKLQMIESKAPNVSSFCLLGWKVKFSLAEISQMKKLEIHRGKFVCYARTELPSHMPNLETLIINSSHEAVNTPMLPTKFLYLKHLTINLWTHFPSYDYFSLVSFLDAAPSLETLTMDVKVINRVLEQENPSDLRQMPEHRHGRLKTVKISSFNSAKSLVELTCYILKNAVSLECITLDTVYGHRSCHLASNKSCTYIPDRDLMEASRALSAIRTYIEDKVPPSVNLTVMEPCGRCHYMRGYLFL